MRNLILILFGLLLFGVSCNPITGIDTRDWLTLNPNNELLSDRQKEILKHNATILAYREMQRQDKNFIHINPALIDAYYNALATILTSNAGLNVDEIQHLAIHHIRLTHLLVEPKGDAPFLENWADSIVTTNITELDALLEDNRFEIKSIHHWSFADNLHFSLQTKSALNTIYISELLLESGYFETASASGLIGGGSNINYLETMEGHKFTFINAYGDCPAGCINNDKYIFMLYKNGTVEFLGIQ